MATDQRENEEKDTTRTATHENASHTSYHSAHHHGLSHLRSHRSHSTFFDRSYMPNTKEIKDIEFESSDPHVAFVRWTLWFTLSLVITDALVAALSTLIVSASYSFTFMYIDHNGYSHRLAPWIFVIDTTCIWCFSLWFVGGYHRHLMGEGYDLYAKIASADFTAVLTAGLICLAARIQIERWQIVWILLFVTLLTAVERWGWRRIVHALRIHGHFRYPVTIVGSWDGIMSALASIRTNVGLGYYAIAVAPIVHDENGVAQADPSAKVSEQKSAWAKRKGVTILTFDSHMPATARSLGSQVVLLVDGIDRGSRYYIAFSLAVQASGMELSIPVATTGDINGGVVFYLHNAAGSMPVLTSSIPQFRWYRRLTKRLFDLVCSLAALVVAAIPMVIIAIAIKCDDGGPVFYRQVRIGQYGKPFTMFKFRSMHVGADKLEQKLARQMGQEGRSTFKAKHDPRITRVGKVLRRTSLDELPQLFNILLGTMSFVGPRPQLPYQRDLNNAVYATRLLVKPGLTGPWQISGRADLSDAQGEQLDVWYVTNNSFTGDLAILLKTIPAVLSGTGAY
jgi:exopolysaccharide biosynthesis polyprenyl glycosylphosphotransferase